MGSVASGASTKVVAEEVQIQESCSNYFEKKTSGTKCLIVKQLSIMQTCLRTCNKMQSIVQLRHSKNTTSKRTSLLTSRRSSTKSTTPPGIAFAEEISAHT